MGGKIMQYFKALRTISLILCFVLVTFGCATGKNQISDTDFGLTAETVPEGILLTFSNIPSDATHLWVFVNSWNGTDDSISSYAAITNTSVKELARSAQQLEKVKQTGQIIFPIVQEGLKYSISANVYNQQEWELFLNERTVENFRFRSAETECIGKNGIYFDRDLINLALNDTNSAVTISSEPVFSSAITFDTQKYSFNVNIMIPEIGSIGVGEHQTPNGLSADGLTWTFEPQMTLNIKGDSATMNLLENGTYYSAWAKAMVNVIYDDINWSIEIAKSPEFTYSL